MKRYDCVILYHNFYSLDGLTDIRSRISRLTRYKVLLLASLAESLSNDPSLQQGEDERLIFSTNMGKDIGGKLLLMDLVTRLYADIPYMVLLHDKRSYQKNSGNFEKEQLFSILSPGMFEKMMDKFETDKKIGIICKKGVIKDEYDAATGNFNTTNSDLLKELKTDYKIDTSDHAFVAGTMFSARTAIYTRFFNANRPAGIRATLEKGNVLDHDHGTVTHSWERLLCWIATSNGYKIQGI